MQFRFCYETDFFLKEFTVATMENAIHHNPKTTPTSENSSILIRPLLVINIRYQRRNVVENIILIMESVFIIYSFILSLLFMDFQVPPFI